MNDFYDMNEAGKFKNNLPYPNKDKFKMFYFYKNGICDGPFTIEQIKEFANNMAKQYKLDWIANSDYIRTRNFLFTDCGYVYQEIIDEEAYKKEKEIYYARETEIYEDFKKCLFEQFDVVDNPKRDTCFFIAWEHGHSSGFNEVYCYFSEIVELIK